MLHSKNVLFILLLTCILSSSAAGQNKVDLRFTKELTAATDNDIYAMSGSDGYYTNGMAIGFSKIKKINNDKNLKTIYKYEVGHKLFTAGIREVYVITEIDRPITGYLYGKFSVNNFKKKDRLVSYGVSVGTIGKNALGEQLLKLYHPLIKINSDWWGWLWRYQLKSEIGINIEGTYAKSLLNRNKLPFIQITPVTQGTLGTTFTNLSQSILFQIGKQNNISESSYWGSALS